MDLPFLISPCIGAARHPLSGVTRRDEYFLHRLLLAIAAKQIASNRRQNKVAAKREKSGALMMTPVWRWLDSALKGTSRPLLRSRIQCASATTISKAPLSQRFKQPRQRLQRNGGRQKDEVSRRGGKPGRTFITVALRRTAFQDSGHRLPKRLATGWQFGFLRRSPERGKVRIAAYLLVGP